MSEKTTPDEDALPQLLGDFRPVDVWQSHMNKVFYGLKGHRLREYYQTFAAADFRLGYALAADYVNRVRTREKRRETPSTSVLTIMEWGCGNGNLAACFLDRVMELDKDRTIYPRIKYYLIDSVETVLEGAKTNADLAKHQDRVTVMQADVQDLGTFGEGTVDRIFCNDLWNELPTKLLLRKSGDLMEEHLRPNLKETRLADFPDWVGFIQAFEQGDLEALNALPDFLEDIVWEREYHGAEAKEMSFRRIIMECMKDIDEEVLVPVNIGAASTLKEAKRLLAADGVGFSSFDAGTVDRMVLNDPEKPCYGLHGGQFSFMVNFALLKEVSSFVGGQPVTMELQKEFVGRSLGTNVISLMDLLASHPNQPKGDQWEMDLLILKTLDALNKTFKSAYQRKIEFPIHPETPSDKRSELEALLASIKLVGVPDTVAYLSEDDVLSARAELEALGYDRYGIQAAFAAPAQSVDYYHFSFTP